MHYEGKKVAVTGWSGFLGSKLCEELEQAGADVIRLKGDVRNILTFVGIDYSVDYLFHLAAPSSQILFKRAADYCVDVTVNGMRNALAACEQNGTKLIYPSTGLLSHGQANEYARSKQICEDLAAGAKADVLGVRIFGTYGPGEEKKRDFASVPYLFMRDIMAGRRPLIFGDGEQRRDFIFIDDTVQALMHVAELKSGGVVDIGTGTSVSFLTLVDLLNDGLTTSIEPILTGRKPKNYIDETGSNIEELSKYYLPQIDMEAGIEAMIKHEEKRC